jgi:hypothetical protein
MEQFKALLRYPQQARPEEGAFLRAFARVTGTVLRSLGDEFAVYVEELTGDNDLVASNLNSDRNFQKYTDPNALLESNIESNDEVSLDLQWILYKKSHLEIPPKPETFIRHNLNSSRDSIQVTANHGINREPKKRIRDNENLDQMVLIAQQAPSGSKVFKVTQEQIIKTLFDYFSAHYNSSNVATTTYKVQDYIYDEALQNLYFCLLQNIGHHTEFPSFNSLLRWAEFLFRKRFLPEAKKRNNNMYAYTKDISSVDNELIYENENKSLLEMVRQCIEEDENQVFKNKYLHRKYSFNFQDIILRRLDGYTWREISDEFNVRISTLAAFYHRSLSELAPLIKEYIHD